MSIIAKAAAAEVYATKLIISIEIRPQNLTKEKHKTEALSYHKTSRLRKCSKQNEKEEEKISTSIMKIYALLFHAVNYDTIIEK